MRLSERVYLVGGGTVGFSLSEEHDCHLNESGKSILFPGDTVFHDGKLLMTNVWDCDLQQYARSIEKLAQQKIDALLPGHLTIAMQQGDRHVQKAWNTLERLTLPPNII